MDTINGKVLEVSHDFESVYHVTIEADISDTVALIRFDLPKLGKDPHFNIAGRLSGERTRVIATTVGEPDLRVGDSVPIKVFYQDEVTLKDGQPVPITEAHNLPNPNNPTHVVPMGTPASPAWAQPEKWIEALRKLGARHAGERDSAPGGGGDRVSRGFEGVHPRAGALGLGDDAEQPR